MVTICPTFNRCSQTEADAQVQERALKAVPDLCDTIDYAEVQGVLFPRVAVHFNH